MSEYEELERELTRIYKREQEKLVRYLDQKTGHPELSDDLAQDTFILLWRKIQAGKLAYIRRALLYRVAEGLRKDHAKRQGSGREKEFELEADRVKRTVNEHLSRLRESSTSPIKSIYQDVLLRLPPEQAQCARLRHECDLNLSEIAQVMGVHESWASRLLRRANRSLIAEFKKRGIKPL